MGLLEEMQRASGSLPDVTVKTDIEPEAASQSYKAAAAYGADVNEVDEDMRRRYKEASIFADTEDVFQDSMQSPVFRAAVKGDEKSASTLGRIVQATAGEVDVDEDGYVSTIRKSAARGEIGLSQMGDISKLLAKRQEVKRLDRLLSLGLGKDEDARAYEEATSEIKALAKDIVLQDAMRKVLSVGTPTAKMAEAYEKDGMSGAIKSMADSGFWKTVADIGVESGVEFGAAAPLIAVAGKVPVLGNVVSGVASGYQDFTLGLLERMAERGVDTSNADEVAKFAIQSPDFDDAVADSLKHAVGVGLFDGLSFGLATKVVPKSLGSSVAVKLPKTAQLYENINRNAFGHAFTNLAAQTVVQGAMGAAGEATGQLIEKGEVTDPLSVMLEAVGEFTGAPLEVATAAVGARSRARFAAAKAQRVQDQLRAAAQVIQSSPSMQKTPELRDAMMQHLAERYEGAESITVDVATLHQADNGQEVIAAIEKALPHRQAEIDEAVASGGTVDLPLQEYGKVIADQQLSNAVIDNSSLPGDDLAVEAKDAESSVIAAKKFSLDKLSEGQTDDFKASMREVETSIGAMLDTGEDGRKTENAAIASIILAQVSAMAQDTGMAPMEVWQAHGIKAVLSEADVKRNEDGTLTAVSEKAKKVLAEGRSLDEALTQPTKGEFIPSKNVIIRWANADRSTLLHETGHWFWQTRMELAVDLKGRPGLTPEQQRFVRSTEDVAKWLGAKDVEHYAAMSLEQRRAAEEKFARSYEQYVKEGVAPTSALRGAFQKFSAWLKRIYGVLAAVKGSELTPDVREMFDAIMVSSQQVKEAQLRRHLFVWLDQAARNENGDLTSEEDRRALNVLMADQDYDAAEEFLKRGKAVVGYLDRLRKRVYADIEAKAKEIRAQFTAEAIARVYGEKRLQAMEKIDKGIKVRDAKGREMSIRPQIPLKELEAAGATKEEIEELRRQKLVTNSEGLHAVPGDYLAEYLGYSSLQEFIAEFGTDPFHGQEPVQAVAAEVEARMLDEHPELSDKETIEDAADAAVFNPSASRLVLLKLNLLDRSIRKPLSMDLVEAVAEAKIRDKKIGDLDPKAYRSSAAKLAKQALKESDAFRASELRRQQLVQMKTAEKAQAAKDRAERFVKTMQKRFDGKIETNSMQLEYLKQIKAILKNLGILNPADNPSMDEKDWRAFFSDESQYVGVPSMPASVAGGTFFDRMTVEEMAQTIEFLDELMAAARERNSVIVNGKKMAMADLDARAVAAIEAHAQRMGRKPVRQNEGRGFGLKVDHAWRNFFYGHMRIQTLWSIFEGEQLGNLGEAFGLRMNKARDSETELRNRYALAMLEAMKPLQQAVKDTKKFFIKELGGTFDKNQLIAMALNVGNDENFERLLAGSPKYTDFRSTDTEWTRNDVLSAIGRYLSKAELEAVQKVWDTVGSLGKDVQALDERTRNHWTALVDAKEVTFTTTDGETVTLKGGYYPIQYDRYASLFRGKADAYENGVDSIMAHGRRNSDTGHSKMRKGINGNPIALTLDAGFMALTDVIHDLTWRELLMDMNKLFNSQSGVVATIKKYHGAEAINSIKDWMEDVATNGKNANIVPVENWLRKNVSIAGLGLNMTTALLQPIGITQSFSVVGWSAVARGVGMYFSNPLRANRDALAKSAMMRDRMRTRFKELAEVQKEIGRKDVGQGVRDSIARMAFKPIVFAQMQCVDIPTWLGSYQKHLEEGTAKGLSGEELEDFAVSRADDDVVRSQGSGALSDLARVERTKSIFNVFYSFFGTVLNAGVLIYNTQSGIKKWTSLATILVLQQLFESCLRAGIEGATGGDDDDYSERLLRRLPGDYISFWTGVFLYAREAGGIVGDLLSGNTNGYSGPAGLRAFVDLQRFAAQSMQGELDTAFWKSASSLWLGDIFGLPSTAFNRFIETMSAVNEGEDVNVPMSLLFGYKKK